MSAADNGGPAFPCMPPADMEGASASGYPYPDAGMSLRDWLAGMALQGFLSGFQTRGFSITPDMQDKIAGGMYSMADAMLSARKEK